MLIGLFIALNVTASLLITQTWLNHSDLTSNSKYNKLSDDIFNIKNAYNKPNLSNIETYNNILNISKYYYHTFQYELSFYSLFLLVQLESSNNNTHINHQLYTLFGWNMIKFNYPTLGAQLFTTNLSLDNNTSYYYVNYFTMICSSYVLPIDDKDGIIEREKVITKLKEFLLLITNDNITVSVDEYLTYTLHTPTFLWSHQGLNDLDIQILYHKVISSLVRGLSYISPYLTTYAHTPVIAIGCRKVYRPPPPTTPLTALLPLLSAPPLPTLPSLSPPPINPFISPLTSPPPPSPLPLLLQLSNNNHHVIPYLPILIKPKIKIALISTNFYDQSIGRLMVDTIRCILLHIQLHTKYNTDRIYTQNVYETDYNKYRMYTNNDKYYSIYEYDLYVYYLEPAGKPPKSDSITTMYERLLGDHFIRLPMNYISVIQYISKQKLDILIYTDLGMHSFPSLLAHSRLARYQLVWWGHPVTSGIDTIDYYLGIYNKCILYMYSIYMHIVFNCYTKNTP